jgi:predicted ATPase
MRIDRLTIPSYRNLNSFTIDLDETQSTTVLLGRNGSGKSNLFEAIVEIFRELEAGRPPTFSYILEYSCHGHTISIDADPDRIRKRHLILVDGKPTTQSLFTKKADEYLPKFIFAYYSGWSDRLERHFEAATRKFYNSILKAQDHQMPLRRLFFCRKEYSQLVLLAFFLEKSPTARNLLEQFLEIKSFDSALFVLKTPWWHKSGSHRKNHMEEGDARFWYALGAFKGFLDRLWQRSLAPIRHRDTVDRDVRRQGESIERLYLFIKNEDELAGLKEETADSKTLFGYMESLFLCDLIDEVRVTVERTDGTRVKFTQMSEGEQQLLTVLGLLLFTQNDESLYLLDEPDTHLNPVWTYEFLSLLQDNIRADKGQLLVATHNPLMIGSLRKNQVRILSSENNKSVSFEPEDDPLGIGVEGLLKSELYGLRSTLAPEILRKMDRHYRLLGKTDINQSEQAEMMRLAAELNELGIARSHPNPYFESFASALARHIPHDETVLTKQDIQEQSELANQLITELIEEERHQQKECRT